MSIAEFNQRQLEIIRTIIADETWLEGERRGCAVQHRDPIVQVRVANILLDGKGAELRRRLESENRRW